MSPSNEEEVRLLRMRFVLVSLKAHDSQKYPIPSEGESVCLHKRLLTETRTQCDRYDMSLVEE